MLDQPMAGTDGKLTVETLCDMFMASEDASYDSRKLAERDKDYYDGKQLSADVIKELRKRGQPEYIDNHIKPKIDYLIGVEKQQRVDPRAWPRTQKHEKDAESASEALRYVADKGRFDYKRSQAWENLLIYGAAGFSITVEPSQKYGDYEVNITRVAWDRMFWDPASAEPDFSDANYLGAVQWMDYDDALALYPDSADALDATLASVTASDTYDDKPKWNLWADKKRRRVRIVEIWIKRNDEWHFAEFTKGGILKAGPSPYVNDQGESDCGLRFQSAYIDRDNNRYGLVREMVPLQDAINKRNSKALHILNTAQVVVKKGLFSDVERLRREAARADGVIEVPETGGALTDSFEFNTRTDLAQGQFLLLQAAQNSIDRKGPNATQMGDKTGGSAAASGKAIIASQQGGMMTLGGLSDNLRHLDLRLFEAIWFRIRQFWTARRWLSTTDDEQNIRWVGINVDPALVQMAAPEQREMIAGTVGNIAEMDCDIIIDEAPDSVVPALEQFEALVQLKQFDTNGELTFEDIILAAPHIQNKEKILKRMRDRRQAAQENPAAQMAQKLQIEGAVAQVEETKSKTALNLAKAQEAGQPDIMAPNAPEVPIELQSMKTIAEIGKIEADTQKSRADAFKTEQEGILAPAKAAQEARDRQADRQSREQQFRQKASQAA